MPALTPAPFTVQAPPPPGRPSLATTVEALDASGVPGRSFGIGDTVTIRVTVENRGGARADVTVPASEHPWDARLADVAGNTVWKASAAWGPAAPTPRRYAVDAGKSVTFKMSATLPAAPGAYVLTGVAPSPIVAPAPIMATPMVLRGGASGGPGVTPRTKPTPLTIVGPLPPVRRIVLTKPASNDPVQRIRLKEADRAIRPGGSRGAGRWGRR